MTLYINGRFLAQRITGEQRHAIETVKCLDSMPKANRIKILVPPEELVTKLDLKNIETIIVGKNKGNKWIQIDLPRYIKRHNGKLLTLSGLSPVIMPGYWTVHDITFARHPESFSRKFRITYDFLYRINLKRCDKVFTVSEFSKNEICERYHLNKDQMVVAYNSANYMLNIKPDNRILDKFNLSKNNFFLSVSSRNAHKNQKYIVECAKVHQNAKFVIAGGKNASFNEIKEETQDNVIYTGYVSDEELAALYSNALGFIFPSLYEGFGIPPLEAIVLDCKHIALSDIPVFRELFAEAYFFDPNNAKDFNLDSFINKTIGSNIRDYYMKKYSFEETSKIYYDTIMNDE